MGKVSFVVGAATGYVVGTRAGRRRYEQMKAGAGKVWHSEPVQRRLGAAQTRVKREVKAAVPLAAAKVFDAAGAAARKAAHSAKHTVHGTTVEQESARTLPTLDAATVHDGGPLHDQDATATPSR
jgi:hypothetical protein